MLNLMPENSTSCNNWTSITFRKTGSLSQFQNLTHMRKEVWLVWPQTTSKNKVILDLKAKAITIVGCKSRYLQLRVKKNTTSNSSNNAYSQIIHHMLQEIQASIKGQTTTFQMNNLNLWSNRCMKLQRSINCLATSSKWSATISTKSCPWLSLQTGSRSKSV